MNFLQRSQPAQKPLLNGYAHAEDYYHNIPLHPTAVFLTITPALATHWLTRNLKNRPLNEAHVGRLATDMAEGRFETNGETIKFDSNGNISDGQHRLAASVASNTSFKSLVVFGCDPGSINTVDIGFARTVGQQLHLSDGLPNANQISAIAHLLLIHEGHGLRTLTDPRKRPTKTQLMYTIRKHSQEFQDALAASRGQSPHLVPDTTLAFCYLVFARQNKGAADRFVEEFKTGAMLAPDNPVHLLRQRLIGNAGAKSKLPKLYTLALFFIAWTKYREGLPMRVLRWRNDGPSPEPFPKI